MRITFNVPDDGLDYLEWIEVDANLACIETNKDDAVDEIWRGAIVRKAGGGAIEVGAPIQFHFPKKMAPGHWNTLGLDPANGLGLPGFPDGLTVKSIG